MYHFLTYGVQESKFICLIHILECIIQVILKYFRTRVEGYLHAQIRYLSIEDTYKKNDFENFETDLHRASLEGKGKNRPKGTFLVM